MGSLFSKEDISKNAITITNCDKTLSPGKYARFESYHNCLTWIHREFKLPGNYQEFTINGVKHLSEKFDYPETITLIQSNNTDANNRFTFKFNYNIPINDNNN